MRKRPQLPDTPVELPKPVCWLPTCLEVVECKNNQGTFRLFCSLEH